MNPILKNILAVVAGIIGGSIVNLIIILLGGMLVPMPEGMNIFDAESVKAGAHLFEPKHFVAPFFAHQIGTFVGAFLAAKIAARRKMLFALVVGVWFLLGGIYAVKMIPAPMWFIVLDLVAYIPVALLGGKLGSGKE